MEWFSINLKQILRRLGRTPMFTVVALVTLGVGVGANTAIFSVLEGVMLKPLPYPHPEELVGVWLTAPKINFPELQLFHSVYFILREQSRTLQEIGLYSMNSVNVTGMADPEKVRALRVTDGTLPVLGIPPMLGRWFNREDSSEGSPETAVLTYGYWRRKFGGDPSIVGRTLIVDGRTCEIIGVMPERFHFLDDDPQLILPIKLDRSRTFLGPPNLPAVARLKPRVTIDQANADVARLLPVVNRSFPPPPGLSVKQLEDIGIGPNVHSLRQVLVGDASKLLWILMGSVGLVLLIACANVANLLLVRTEGRQQELAVRAALGASRGQVARELLLESLVLGLLGSVVGLGFAQASLRLLVRMSPTRLPRLSEIGIDAPVLLFAVGVSLLASLLFGCVPALKYAGAHLGTGLRAGGRTLSESRERHWVRNTLVVVQVALAFVLLISSGLMIRTFRALRRVPTGFVRPAEVQTISLTIPAAEVRDPERLVHMQEEILRRIEAIPGVSSVGLGTGVPMDGNLSANPVVASDRTYREDKLPPLRRFKFVSPEYVKSIGASLVVGRDFTWTDIYNKRPVVMISENLAREYWGEPASALGKRIRMGKTDDWSEIIGVVADIRDDGVNQKAPTSVCWPIMMRHFYNEEPMVRRTVTYAIRSPRTGSESFLNEVRQAVWSVDNNLPLADAQTLEYFYRKSLARASFALVMLDVAGGMALLLGTVGLYGVIAYSVSQRRREIGIRLALGAQQQQITGMFVRHGLWLVALGVACGLGAAIPLMRLMTSLLFEVKPVDPVSYAAVALGLAATGALASYLSCRRVTAIDPVEAMRAE
jgi:predicted permease